MVQVGEIGKGDPDHARLDDAVQLVEVRLEQALGDGDDWLGALHDLRSVRARYVLGTCTHHACTWHMVAASMHYYLRH